MKNYLLFLFFIFSIHAKADESQIKDFNLIGDCNGLLVEKKPLNSVQSIAITQNPNVSYSAYAPIGPLTVKKKCIVDINLSVPANHKVGVYDPQTNHLHLGRFNGTQYLYDQRSSYKWEVTWDLADSSGIPMQSASAIQMGPLASNYFGQDFQMF